MKILGIDLGKDKIGVGLITQLPTSNIAEDAFTIDVSGAVNGIQRAIKDRDG